MVAGRSRQKPGRKAGLGKQPCTQYGLAFEIALEHCKSCSVVVPCSLASSLVAPRQIVQTSFQISVCCVNLSVVLTVSAVLLFIDFVMIASVYSNTVLKFLCKKRLEIKK